MGEAIFECFGNRFYDLELYYSIQKKPLGTGLAVRQATKDFLHKTKRVVILNGDTWFPIDYKTVIDLHVKSKMLLSCICHDDVYAGTFIAETKWLKDLKKKKFEDNFPQSVLIQNWPEGFIDIGTPQGYSRANFTLGV